MRTNLRLILGILAGVVSAAVIVSGFLFFWREDEAYQLRLSEQADQAKYLGYETLETHQFGLLLQTCKSPYMGDAGNMSNLFDRLLLTRAGVSIAIDADTYTVQVYYQTTEEELGSGNVRAALAYNSVAAFTLIDNLEHIEYTFPGNNFVYKIDRTAVEAWFNTQDLADYFPSQWVWEDSFQEPLKQEEYLNEFFLNNFQEDDYRNPNFNAGTDTQNGAVVGSRTDGAGE